MNNLIIYWSAAGLLEVLIFYYYLHFSKKKEKYNNLFSQYEPLTAIPAETLKLIVVMVFLAFGGITLPIGIALKILKFFGFIEDTEL